MASKRERDFLNSTAQIDRAMAGLREGMATGIAGYFNKLLESGLTRQEALTLSVSMQNGLLALCGMRGMEGKEENDG